MITGHSGFKGTWLSIDENSGAKVTAFITTTNKRNISTIGLKNKTDKNFFLNIKDKRKLEKQLSNQNHI